MNSFSSKVSKRSHEPGRLDEVIGTTGCGGGKVGPLRLCDRLTRFKEAAADMAVKTFKIVDAWGIAVDDEPKIEGPRKLFMALNSYCFKMRLKCSLIIPPFDDEFGLGNLSIFRKFLFTAATSSNIPLSIIPLENTHTNAYQIVTREIAKQQEKINHTIFHRYAQPKEKSIRIPERKFWDEIIALVYWKMEFKKILTLCA
uniref:Uncharacterized protein n=1 Tax=Romanomermis culicivorax TaxID=13658 RepID=A0A915KT26_ROMCU